MQNGESLGRSVAEHKTLLQDETQMNIVLQVWTSYPVDTSEALQQAHGKAFHLLCANVKFGMFLKELWARFREAAACLPYSMHDRQVLVRESWCLQQLHAERRLEVELCSASATSGQ